MKTFLQFIREELTSGPAFNLPRSQMPQIKDIDSFLSYISAHGHLYIDMFGTVDNFRPTQTDYDKDKVDRIKQDMIRNPRSNTKPILVSSDGFILDGHHRYLATKQLNGMIAYYELSTNVTDSLKLAYDFLNMSQGV